MDKITIRNRKDYNDKIKNKTILKTSFNIYVRVSTKQQIENTSLDNQGDIGLKYFKNNQNQYDHVIIWREEGKSGDDLHNRNDEDMVELVSRELMGIIISGWEENLIHNLWVSDLSRLSRNEDVSNFIKGKLYQNGVELFVGNQQYNFDSMTDKLLFGVLSVFNEYENNLRFHKGMMGKLKNLESSKWWGGPIPFGYKLDENQRLIEDDRTGKIVKKIFNYYSQGKSTIYIKGLLERIGVKTQRGNKFWNLNSIRKILGNKTYLGKMEYEVRGLKGKSKEYCRKKGKLFNHTVKVEQLIDYETFNRCQKRKNNRGLNRQLINTKNNHLLTGLLYCGSCGKIFSGRKNQKSYTNHYFCSSSWERWRDNRISKCNVRKSINMNVCDKLIWDTVLNVWENSHLIKEKFRETHLPNYHKDIENLKSDIKNKKSRIGRIKNKIINLNIRKDKLLNDYVILKLNDKRFKELNNLIDCQIDLEEEKISSTNKEVELLEKGNLFDGWLDDFKNHTETIKSITNKEDKSKFLNEIVKKIEVYWDDITNTHSLKIFFKWRIVKDVRNKKEKYVFEILNGKNYYEIDNINCKKIIKRRKQKNLQNPTELNYSTVTDFAKFLG